MTGLNDISKQFADALIHMDEHQCRILLKPDPPQGDGLILAENVVIPSLEYIGIAWEKGHISLSQVYMAGRICEKIISEEFKINGPSLYERPRLAIGVIGDYHALGKRMVLSALRSSGYNLRDYGLGLKADDLVEKTLQDKVDILLLSCLMLTSALHVKDVVEGLAKAGSRTVVMVGGAPFRLAPLLQKEVGAHYMGRNSGEATRIIRTLTENRIWE